MTAPTKLDGRGKPPTGEAAQQARYEQLGTEFENPTPPAASPPPKRPAAKAPAPAKAPAAPKDPPPAAPEPARVGSGLPGADAGSGGVAGFALGLVGMAVLVNFMRGGTPQVRRWFAAKFLNVTTGAPAAGGSATKAAPAALVTTAGAAATLPGTSPWGAW